jgi:hypothetical protein
VQDIRSKPIVYPKVPAAPTVPPGRRTWKNSFRKSTEKGKEKHHSGYRDVTQPDSMYRFRSPIHSALNHIVAKITQNGTLPHNRWYIDISEVRDEKSLVTYFFESCLYDELKKELRRILPPRQVIYY